MDSIIFLAFALAYLALIIFLWKGYKNIQLSSVLFRLMYRVTRLQISLNCSYSLHLS